jgi:hypothetical protein
MAIRTKIAGGAAALALAAGLVAAVPNEAAAQWRGGHGWHGGGWRGPGVAAGVVGGLALGAIAAGAAGNYYGPGYYAAPAYGPDCYLTRERVWNGYTWVWRRVQVCN